MIKFLLFVLGVVCVLSVISVLPVKQREVHEDLEVRYVEVIYCRDYGEDVRKYGMDVAFSLIEPGDLEKCYGGLGDLR